MPINDISPEQVPGTLPRQAWMEIRYRPFVDLQGEREGG